jgi:hypothetical protein
MSNPPRRRQLTPDQELDLWLGPYLPDAFASPEERRAAWFTFRDQLIGVVPSSPGRRPQGWWTYEAPTPFPGLDRERSTLYRAGLLGEAERIELETEWREQFDRAQASDFWFTVGPDEILEGSRARRALYAWTDIPRELVKKWTAERRRQVRRIEVMAGA